MGYQLMDLKSAAAHLHMSANELRHFAQREEVPCVKRGEAFFFEHRPLDEWAQRRMLEMSEKQLAQEHQAAMSERRRAEGQDFHIADILRPETIMPELTSKTRAGVLRDMTDFADTTGLLYDPETLFAELTAREEVASTAAGGGVAFLHPRYHDPYLFQETFLALGRTVRPVFFGSPAMSGLYSKTVSKSITSPAGCIMVFFSSAIAFSPYLYSLEMISNWQEALNRNTPLGTSVRRNAPLIYKITGL